MRDATPADADALAHVRVTTWRDAYAHIYTHEQLASLSVGESAERWRGELEAALSRFHTLVAQVEGAVVGFASFGPREFDADEKHVGELYAIYVLPDAQGQGVGQALMAETTSRLHDDRFDDAVLWVFEDNPRTRRFYEDAGWSTDGGTKDVTWLGTTAPAVCYRFSFERRNR